MRTTLLKNVILGILLLTTLFLVVYLFFLQPKIVYVDSAKLLNGYKAMQKAKSEFEYKQQVWNSNVDSLSNDVQEAIKKYEKSASIGSATEKQMARELISAKQKVLYDYQNALKQNAGQEEQKLTQGVFSTINAFLIRYGKKNNYKMILIAANGNIGYAEEKLDITEKVVDELNKEYSPQQK